MESVGEPIVGALVLDIAAASSVPARMITCARCHGHCLAGTRFCKYCGAVLEEARAVLPPRAPSPEGTPSPEAAPSPDPPARAVPRPAAFGASATPAPQAQPATNGASRPVPVAHPSDGPLSVPRPVAAAPPPVRRDEVRVPPPSLGPAPIAPPAPAAAAPVPVMVAGGEPSAWGPVPAKHDLGVRILPDLGPANQAPREAQAAPVGSPTQPATHAQAWGIARSPAPGASPAGPSPAADPRGSGRLVVIVEDGSEGRSFSMASGQLDVGRTEGNIVLEDDPYVSPRHARLARTGSSWTVRDLASTNGVYLRLRKQHPLVDGDLLLLGLEVLQFQTVNDGERGLGHAIQHGTFVFGSPATRGSMARARLCQRTVEGVTRDVYHLFRDETVIGREVGDIVFTADPFLSRRHAAIVRNPVSSEFGIVDLDSSNGTYVAIRGEVAVGDGDYLRIGQHLFRVDLG